jgi:hypothetical protein
VDGLAWVGWIGFSVGGWEATSGSFCAKFIAKMLGGQENMNLRDGAACKLEVDE